jgi:hypothetical protein
VASLKRILFICALAVAASSIWTSSADAQIIIAGRVPVRRAFVGVYGDPFLFDPWWGGYEQWGPYPYPYPYPFRYRDPGAAVRLEVTPKQAEVYVDGYYAGVVDDFNGHFQHLNLTPGGHHIDVRAPGFQPLAFDTYIQPDHTHTEGAPADTVAGASRSRRIRLRAMLPRRPARAATASRVHAAHAPRSGAMPRVQPSPQNAPDMPPQGSAAGYGTVSIRVQPSDAEILIDGQPWRGPATNDRLIVDVAEGRHSVDIRKSGYVGYVTEVQVRRGETTPLNVSLRTQDDR